jgi:hypothetical protein
MLNLQQWNQMDFFLKEMQQGTKEDLVEHIKEEQKKPWKNRRIAALGDDLYEYRGKESRLGTIRVYFSFNEEIVLVIDAEYKTSDHDMIERAKTRLKEMFSIKKGK